MDLIAYFGLFNGLLALLLIIAYSFRRGANRIFLGLSLLCVWHSLFMVHLNVTGLVLKFPALHRTGLLTAYLAFPFLYIYSRNTFYPGKFWRKTDWLFLLPAMLYTIDFLPFFLLPPEQKIEIFRENISNTAKIFLADEGWLGLPGFHFTFIYIWIAIIMFLQARLIILNWNLESGFKTAHNRRLLYFILTITLLYVPLFIPGIFGIIFKLPWFSANFVLLTFGVSLGMTSIYLFISPDILYGFVPEVKFSHLKKEEILQYELPDSRLAPVINIKSKPRIESTEQIKEIDISHDSSEADEIAAEIEIILKHMNDNKPYCQQGFTIQDLSNQTGIPVYQLSPLINGHFKLNFANWVNRYRIEYFIEQAVDNPNITLEAISKEAGFISRSTFINAFKKEKGVTPKEYIKSLKP